MIHATCHPERKSEGNGLCGPCYRRQYYLSHKEQISRKAKMRYRAGGKGEWETYYTKNRERIVERQRQYREKHKIAINLKQKANWSRYKYGISLETVDQLLVGQHNKCAGCQEDFTGSLYPCVDHCHISNKVRGMLCDPCNKSIGILKENVETLRRLADYLEVHSK